MRPVRLTRAQQQALTRERLLAAAERVLARHGYSGASKPFACPPVMSRRPTLRETPRQGLRNVTPLPHREAQSWELTV